MRGLSLRIVVIVAATGLVSASLLHVSFVLLAHGQRVAEARAHQDRLATDVGSLWARLAPDERAASLRELSARHGMIVAVRSDGQWWTSEGAPSVADELEVGRSRVDGVEYLTAHGASGEGFDRLVVGRPLAQVVDSTLALQSRWLVLLALALLIGAGLCWWFLRRAILRPLARLSGLVGAADVDALSRFGLASPDDFSSLGRAIAGMSQRLAEDRTRIQSQLDALSVVHRDLSAAQAQVVRGERLAVTGQLAAGLAHEIGNPLAVLSGYLDMLKSGGMNDAELSQAVGRMQRELQRVNVIIRELLGFARAGEEAGRGRGSLRAAVEHVRALVSPQERFRAVQLGWPRQPLPEDCVLSTDALTQVLLNLLLNAAEATPAGGTIRVEVESTDAAIELSVDDSGPGVPAELRQRIFAPFFSTKGAVAPSGRATAGEGELLGGGTGLGLSVCESLVGAAGGELRLETSSLGGARFVVRLPARATAER